MPSPRILVSSLLLLASGCSLFQGDLAQATVDDLKDLRGELTKGMAEIAAVTESLDTLTTEGGDMREEYDAFCDAVDDVEAQSEDVESIRKRVAEHREAYLDLWQEQLGTIQSAELRERSAARRDEVIERFDDLRGDGEKIRGNFDKWLQSLQDIRTALKFDLNPEGIDTVARQSNRVSREAEDIVESIEEFEQSLDALVDKLEASKPPAPDGANS